MPVPVVGPCEPWTSEEEITACGAPDGDLNFEAAVDFASQVLFGLSGRQYPGACEETTRPCRGSNGGCLGLEDGYAASWWWGYPSYPVRDSSGWLNIGACGGVCHISCIELPGPVNEITEVIVDGVVLDPSTYGLNGFGQLCRFDGEWPCSQDFTLPLTAVGTWGISWTRGKPISPVMREFATQLGVEFLKSMCGAESCLPSNVDSVVRDGVTVTFEDTETLFQDGKTGLGMVDLWLSTVNPKRIARRASVHRADDPARKRKRFY